MAIAQGLCTSFKVELMDGVHAFGPTVVRTTDAPDTFMLALYTKDASLGPDTMFYTAEAEVSGAGYTAGGIELTVNPVPESSGTTAFVNFDSVSWESADFTARAGLIYNLTQGSRAVAVLDFGADKTSSGGTFTVQFPTTSATSALVRIS